MSSSDDHPPMGAGYDVVVCGGGPAGIGAAVMAARRGARTLLVERLGHLGGNSTGAGVVNWGDTPGGPVFDELHARLRKVGAAKLQFDPKVHRPPGKPQLESESVKAVSLQLAREAGADVLFLTFSESAWMEGDRAVGVFVVNKGGRAPIRAKVVIDATADGDIAVSAGAEFAKGDPTDGRLQHSNFRFWIEGIDHDKAARNRLPDDELVALLKEAQAQGELHPPNHLFQPGAEAFPFNLRTGSLWTNNWEFEKIDPTDPVAVSNALAECQIAALEVVQFCRRHVPGYEDCSIRKLPDFLGARESRRLIGRYVLTREDVLAGRKFVDGIARACFYIDYHDSPPGPTIPHTAEFLKANAPPENDCYEIPYRCLLPKRIAGLLVAGRCISCDRDAHASLRVMPTCMFTGTAAGMAGALAAKEGQCPEQIDGKLLKRLLLQGATVA